MSVEREFRTADMSSCSRNVMMVCKMKRNLSNKASSQSKLGRNSHKMKFKPTMQLDLSLVNSVGDYDPEDDDVDDSVNELPMNKLNLSTLGNTSTTESYDAMDNGLACYTDDCPANLAQEVSKIKNVGRGAGGIVYLSCYLPSLKIVALKEVQVYKEEDRRMIQHELHALHENLVPIDESNEGMLSWLFHKHSNIGTSHPCPYIVSFYGAFPTPAKPSVCIVMEYMNAGSLQGLLAAGGVQSECILRHVAFCCLKALSHMHENNFIHRDIKPANILLNKSGNFKVADLGLATTLSKSKSFFSDFQGTMMYMAPERISGQQYTYTSDIWSVGIVLLSLALGEYPFDVEDGFFGLEEAIVSEPCPPLPRNFSSEFRDFLKKILLKDPKERLSAKSALQHPFLSDYNESKMKASNFQNEWKKIDLPEASSYINEVVKTVVQLKNDLKGKTNHGQTIFQLKKYFNASSQKSFSQRELTNLANDCGVTEMEVKNALWSVTDTSNTAMVV